MKRIVAAPAVWNWTPCDGADVGNWNSNLGESPDSVLLFRWLLDLRMLQRVEGHRKSACLIEFLRIRRCQITGVHLHDLHVSTIEPGGDLLEGPGR